MEANTSSGLIEKCVQDALDSVELALMVASKGDMSARVTDTLSRLQQVTEAAVSIIEHDAKMRLISR